VQLCPNFNEEVFHAGEDGGEILEGKGHKCRVTVCRRIGRGQPGLDLLSRCPGNENSGSGTEKV
jgi:hypothetical protein